jgi:hypothetical protein
LAFPAGVRKAALIIGKAIRNDLLVLFKAMRLLEV